MHRIARRSAALMAVAAVAAAVGVPVAQADDAAVRAAILAQDQALKQSPQIMAAESKLSSDPKNAAKVVSSINTFIVQLEHAVIAVRATVPSTNAGSQGRTDWLDGVRDLTRGLRDLRQAIVDVAQGKKAQARSALQKTAVHIKTGNAEGLAADTLLGLPKNS